MALVGQASLSSDQEKFLAATLVENILLRLVAKSVCDPVEMNDGMGVTANFVRYRRMNVPVATLTEGTDPTSSTFVLDALTVTLDQWGDILEVTDIGELSVKHPIMTQMVELLADNAQRVIDREIQIVWLAGTNVQFGDGSVASRSTITTAMKASTANLLKTRVTLVDAGAPPRYGPGNVGPVNNARVDGTASDGMFTGGAHYLAIAGPQVMADIAAETTAIGSWMSVQIYQNKTAVYNFEVGTWLGMRWVESNFIPKFRILGGTTTAVVSGNSFGTDTPVVTAGTAGVLTQSASYEFKVTRKDLLRGFEEFISIVHTMSATGAGGQTQSFSFNFGAVTTGFVYNIYFDSVLAGSGGGPTDALAKLSTQGTNVAAGSTVVITNVGTGAGSPQNVNTTGTPTIHPIYIHAMHSCNWVSLQNLQAYLTDNTKSYYGNILRLKRAAGYKFFGKTMIRNQTHLLRVELASAF